MIEGQVRDRTGLGPIALPISSLGIGTWAWGDRLIWNYGREYDDQQARAAFQASLDAGINFFDTAEIYGSGMSEKLLGKFIAESGTQVVLATKFMPYPWRPGKGSLRAALKRSLERLQLSRVDLYQIHWPAPPFRPETWMEAMADAVEAGLIGAAGVSNYSARWMERSQAALERRGMRLASNQVEYSLLQRAPERNGVLQACRDTGATLIAYSPLAMGVLTGKYTPEKPLPGYRGQKYGKRYLARVAPLLSLMREIGEAHGKTPSQVALNWVICKGAVPIVGARDARQAQENAGAMGWRLGENEVAALDEVSERVKSARKA